MTGSTTRAFASFCIAGLAAAALTSCMPEQRVMELQYEGLSLRPAEVCADLSVEVSGWSEREDDLVVTARDKRSGEVGKNYLGTIESRVSDASFEWECLVTTDASDTRMTAEMTKFDPR